jgi:hypothetical protein
LWIVDRSMTMVFLWIIDRLVQLFECPSHQGIIFPITRFTKSGSLNDSTEYFSAMESWIQK